MKRYSGLKEERVKGTSVRGGGRGRADEGESITYTGREQGIDPFLYGIIINNNSAFC